jgi:hypothetical protein
VIGEVPKAERNVIGMNSSNINYTAIYGRGRVSAAIGNSDNIIEKQ